MNNLEKLAEIFEHFPGIGPRQARRFVNFLLRKREDDLKRISSLISGIKKDTGMCAICRRYFPLSARGSNDRCQICTDENRDNSALMIVANEVDLENIEKSGSFRGRYFVLGGTLPILEKEPQKKIRATELYKHVERGFKTGQLREIILALNLNPEGENTADFITDLLSPFKTQAKQSGTGEGGVKISHLGRGLSTGIEIEYSDSETLKNAIRNRA